MASSDAATASAGRALLVGATGGDVASATEHAAAIIADKRPHRRASGW